MTIAALYGSRIIIQRWQCTAPEVLFHGVVVGQVCGHQTATRIGTTGSTVHKDGLVGVVLGVGVSIIFGRGGGYTSKEYRG